MHESEGKAPLRKASRVPRRNFLAGLAAVGASALLPAGQATAQDSTRPFLIDTHYHFSSPGFIAAIKARNTGQRPLMEWTPEKAIEDMDKDGVATSIVSTSEPSVWFGDNFAARDLARECNEYGARLMSDYPGRFGMFATLPLPDVDGALHELEYSLDKLKADGVCMMTSYQGKYPGDPMFTPLMEELNRRKAVVYSHPFRAECCVDILPPGMGLGILLTTDTTYAIASVLFSGTASRYPDIRFIWSHGGGTMPYITGRFRGARFKTELPKGPIYEIQKMYYDTAQAYNKYTLPTFTKLVPIPHILFGTDYPFSRASVVAAGLREYGFSPSDLRAIERENALALFPRLKT